MKCAILFAAPLLAMFGSPILAAEPGPDVVQPSLKRAVLTSTIQTEDLRRIVAVLILDDARSLRVDQRQALEAVKARIKAALESGRSRDPADGKDCPEKAANQPSHSPSPHSVDGGHKIDCVHCTDRTVTV